MYVNPFVCGVIVGALATFAGFLAWSVWLSKNDSDYNKSDY